MSELSLEKRIENLKSQQEQAKDIFIKCQGAIELLEGMAEEKDKKEEKKDSKK